MQCATATSGPAAMPTAAAGASVTPPITGAAAQGGPEGSTPLAKRPATLVASGVGPGPPPHAKGNVGLTKMAVAMDTRIRAIEQRITASAVPALDDHALNLDTLKDGQAQLGVPHL